MILLSWLFASAGSLLFGMSVLQMFGWGMMQNAGFFLPMLAVSLAAAILIRLMKRRRMLACVPATIAQWVLCSYITMRCGADHTALIPSLLVAAFIPYHLLMLCQEPGEEYPPTIWYLGVLLHGLCLFLLRADYFAGAKTFFQTTALLYAVFVIFALNELSLSHGMAGDRRPSPLMRWRNRIRAGILALGLTIACNLKSIARAAEAAANFCKMIIAAILRYLFREKPTEYVQESGRGGMDLSALAGEIKETPLFWRILEKIMYVVALIMCVALAYLMIKKLIELTKKAVRFLIAQLRRYAGQVNNAYEDTVESLMDWGEMRRVFRIHREKKMKPAPVNWAQLSPRESVRMRYKLLRGKTQPASHLTARQVIKTEKISAQAADLYDRARYSDAKITAADADKMKEMLRG